MVADGHRRGADARPIRCAPGLHGAWLVTTFRCDECEQTWDRSDVSTTVLRVMVAHHLWTVHAINGIDAEDRLPMTDEQVAWVRAQRTEARSD